MADWDVASVAEPAQPAAPAAPQPPSEWTVKTIGDPNWTPRAVDGVAGGPRQGFWGDFAQGTGGFVGLVKAPFTESIPAELFKLSKEQIKHDWTKVITDPFAMGLVQQKVEEFMRSPEGKDLPEKIKRAYHDTIALAKQRPGLVAGSLLRGLAADPELFFVPGFGEAGAGAKATEAAAKVVGAGRTADVVGAVAGKATAVGTGAALGGGTEGLRELSEGQDFDVGQIGLSATLGGLAGGASIAPKKVKLRPMTADEIDRVLAPAMPHPDAVPKADIVPTADGYLVRMGEQAEGKTYLTKAEAEHAARELEANASGYRSMGTVPRGSDSGSARRARFLHDNPFTPEKMAEMVSRPKEDLEPAGKRLIRLAAKAAVPAAIGAGIGYWLDRDDPGMGAGFGAAVTVVPRLLPKDRRISIENVINTRNGFLAVMARHTLQFKSAIEALVPEKMRREAISLAMEGHEGITLNANERRVAMMVRQFYEAMGNTAVDAGVLKELLSNYVTHIVEPDPEAVSRGTFDRIVDVLTGRGDRPTGASGRQFAQHRRYATFHELQQALRGSGLRIKTGDIGEIMAVYSGAMFKALTDKRMLDALKVTPVEGMAPFVVRHEPEPAAARAPGETVEGTATDLGAPPDKLPPPRSVTPREAVRAGGGAPPPALPDEPIGFRLPAGAEPPPPGESAQRYAQRERFLVQSADKADSNYVTMPGRMLAGFVVHRDIAPQLNFVLHARDPNDVTLGLMALNQASKRAIVSFSLFHAKSLSDAYIGAMGLKGAADVAKLVSGQHAKTMVDWALAQFRYGGSNDGIDDLLHGGLIVQAPEDIAPDRMNAALTKIAGIVDSTLPVSPATKAVKGFAKFNESLDHMTFAYLQTGFKLVTGLDAYERLIKKGVPRKAAGQMAASYANDLYGSLDWFRVANDVGSRIGRDIAYGFFNPNGRRWMQLMMFAPDWTMSTFRAAYKALPGATDDAALASLHRRYLAKSALYYLTIANGINLITSGHSIFSNENPTRIQLADGRTMQFSKHFMEPFEWLRDPLQTAANKLAFLPREAVQQLTGKEYISVHDSAPDIENRANHLARQFAPIPAQQGLAGGGAESALGLAGMPIYGKTPEQKRESRLEKKRAQEERRKKTAEYYRRLNP